MIVNDIYNTYWDKMKQHNIVPKKYNWAFDRNKLCDSLFSSRKEEIIVRRNFYENKIKDGFLSRFTSRGFSDMVAVPDDVHILVMNDVINGIKKKYGDNFDEEAYKGIEEDIELTIYTK